MNPVRILTSAIAIALPLVAAWPSPPAAGAEGPSEQPIHPGLHYWEPVRGRVVPERLAVDICVYGGTSAGIVAAVQARRLGRTVVLVAPEAHLGGLTTGGLTNTDIGNKGAIGGISREFYQRVGKKYGEPEEWRFEPKIAEQVYAEMLAEARVPVRTQHFLKSIRKQGARIVELATERGLTVAAAVFIDASYEGDLMAKSGVRYTIGREDNGMYRETLNGVQVRDKHQFEAAVSPYVAEGDPRSGLLPGISPETPPAAGTGDRRVQAYNFRMTLTTVAANRIPFAKPAGYDRRQYELLARTLRTGWNEVFKKFDPIRGEKVDTNNHGPVSTDFIGQNYGYADGSYRERERIFQRHAVYQQGLMWFLANDPAVPDAIRSKMGQWGLCKDEFTDTGGWPRQLYVREARRMISDYVMTEHNCRGTVRAEDAVGLAAYGMDSHNCQRFAKDGRVWNEGDVQAGGFPPYPIAYRSIVPKRDECENLLVPVCLSASHIAYGSIRMEPVFMILAQSAATAADLALKSDVAVQGVDVAKLQERLLADGQILEWKQQGRSAAAPLAGIVVDDSQAVKTGEWVQSQRGGEALSGAGYVHDGNTHKGAASIAFTPELPAEGEYEVFLLAPPNPNRASNAPVTLAVAGREPLRLTVDLRLETSGGRVSLGRHRLPEGRATTVTLSNAGTDGYVVADGAQFVPVTGG